MAPQTGHLIFTQIERQSVRMPLQYVLHRVTHLRDVLRMTRMECRADRRLISAAVTSARMPHNLVRSHASIDLDDSLASGKDVDPTIEQLLKWSLLLRLLVDLDLSADFRPEPHLLKAYSPRDKTCAGRKFDLLFVPRGSSQDFQLCR